MHSDFPNTLYKVILQNDLHVLAFAPGFPVLGQFISFIELVTWPSGNALDVQVLERTPADTE